MEQIHILIESSGSPKFLTLNVVKKFRCKIQFVEPLTIDEANGNSFIWWLEGKPFQIDVLILEILSLEFLHEILWINTIIMLFLGGRKCLYNDLNNVYLVNYGALWAMFEDEESTSKFLLDGFFIEKL